jgi:hypothetical protein
MQHSTAYNYYLRDQREFFYASILLIVTAARIVAAVAAAASAWQITLFDLDKQLNILYFKP